MCVHVCRTEVTEHADWPTNWKERWWEGGGRLELLRRGRFAMWVRQTDRRWRGRGKGVKNEKESGAVKWHTGVFMSPPERLLVVGGRGAVWWEITWGVKTRSWKRREKGDRIVLGWQERKGLSKRENDRWELRRAGGAGGRGCCEVERPKKKKLKTKRRRTKWHQAGNWEVSRKRAVRS